MRPVDTTRLTAAITTLTRREPMPPPHGLRHRGISLLAQLHQAVLAGGIRTGPASGGHGAASRPPVDVDALDLWRGIARTVDVWAAELQVDDRAHRHRAARAARWDHAGRLVVPEPAEATLLRAIAVRAASRWPQSVVDDTAREVEGWIRVAAAVVTGGTSTRALRGVACWGCGATTVSVVRDGDPTRVPALVAALTPGSGVVEVLCRGCGATRSRVEGGPVSLARLRARHAVRVSA